MVEAAPVAEHGRRVERLGDPVGQGRAHAGALPASLAAISSIGSAASRPNSRAAG